MDFLFVSVYDIRKQCPERVFLFPLAISDF